MKQPRYVGRNTYTYQTCNMDVYTYIPHVKTVSLALVFVITQYHISYSHISSFTVCEMYASYSHLLWEPLHSSTYICGGWINMRVVRSLPVDGRSLHVSED